MERLRAGLAPLARRYDAVVANPPYMGAKNMNAWLGGWVKKRYPDVKGDLFSCFMVRNSRMGAEHAQLGFMTPYVWMFIGTYEKLRRFVVEENTITSLIQLEYSGFSGATVPICTFTLQKGCCPGYRGGYVRLSDFVGADQQEPRALQALADPDCGWFYRADARDFKAIPGSPIAYWASKAMRESFIKSTSLNSFARPRQGLATGNNDLFLREWWETSESSKVGWIPCTKGGGFRKWYGDAEWLINWTDNGKILNEYSGAVIRNQDWYFKEGTTWGMVSSAAFSMRYLPSGFVFTNAGLASIASSHRDNLHVLAFMNSSVSESILRVLAPTLNFSNGDLGRIPILPSTANDKSLEICETNIALSKIDWDSRETSWDFGRNPLI